MPETYAAGESELETIARAIEQGDIPIDKLSLAVKRADFLNRHLEQQLLNIGVVARSHELVTADRLNQYFSLQIAGAFY